MNPAFIAPNFAGIPTELRELPRWVTWRAESEGGKTKPRKTPYRADLPHALASSTDPETWCSFEQAETAYFEGDRTGVGLVLDGTGDLAGVDIDGCRDAATGVVDPAALALLEGMRAAYVEVSPSGTGLRAFGYAPPLDTGCAGTLDGLKLELYSKGRYLTLTGQTIKAGPLAPLRGFGGLAERIRAGRKVNPETGEIEQSAPDEHHAELVRRILSGDVFHDSLRDLAASLVATGMRPGAVVNHLRGLMDASAAPHDGRWRARRQQIPALVTSAAAKYAPPAPDVSPLMGLDEASTVPTVHPLARYVDLDAEPMAPRFVIPGFIGYGLVIFAGTHGVGKTTALLPLAMVAAGLHGNGDPLAPKHWRHVVYITEDPEQARRILTGIVKFGGLGLDMGTVRERLHIVEARRLEPSYVAEVATTYREQFARSVDGVEVPPLVVMDTKSAVFSIEEENDNSEASAIVAMLKQAFESLPVWLVGHVAKANMSRGDVAGLSLRGAGAFEGDANQTLYLVKEGEDRYLVRGKTRFEAEWTELQIEGKTAATMARDEFGDLKAVTLRWGIASPPERTRKEAQQQAQEAAHKADAAALRDEVRDVIEVAWIGGFPLNREGVKAKVKRNRAEVTDTIENLLTERWLHEVAIPSKERTNPNRAAFLVNLTTEEHDAVRRGDGWPPAKLEVPASWRKPGAPSVPEPMQQKEEGAAHASQ